MSAFSSINNTPVAGDASEVRRKSNLSVDKHKSNAASNSAKCTCGGNCPACKEKIAPMRISQPGDIAEIQADQIADKVMRMPQGDDEFSASDTNSSSAIQREDRASGSEENTIQRKPVSSESSVASQSPAHVSNAVSSGGHPLDNETRNFFEPRMGRDFGNVRIHTDSNANHSAHAIDAKAYTLGNNIVFGAGEYMPKSSSGQHLLAHELAHVSQATHAAYGEPVIYRRPAARTIPRAQGRYAREHPYARNTGGNNDPKTVGQDNGADTDWGAASNLRRLQGKLQGKIFNAQSPMAVLFPGGSPPDFITLGAPTESMYGDGTKIRYTPHYFHIIDAMEHDFDLSTSYEEDIGLYINYFPETDLLPGQLQKQTMPGLKTYYQSPDGKSYSPKLPAGAAIGKVNFNYDNGSIQQRLKALNEILLHRKRKRKLIRENAVLEEAERSALTDKGKKREIGACNVKRTGRKGGRSEHAAKHSKYAIHVADVKGYGIVKDELTWSTPEGVEYSFDTYNPSDMTQVWEVKTRHEWASPERIADSPRYIANFSERIMDLEAQRLRGIYVASRCGLAFRYAFDNCGAYRGFKQQWILPPLEYIPYPGEPKEICNE